MENQHRVITGYRELSVEELALINEIKAEGERVGALVARLQAHSTTAGDAQSGRWVSIGRTHLQEGFMALTRAVARPSSF